MSSSSPQPPPPPPPGGRASPLTSSSPGEAYGSGHNMSTVEYSSSSSISSPSVTLHPYENIYYSYGHSSYPMDSLGGMSSANTYPPVAQPPPASISPYFYPLGNSTSSSSFNLEEYTFPSHYQHLAQYQHEHAHHHHQPYANSIAASPPSRTEFVTPPALQQQHQLVRSRNAFQSSRNQQKIQHKISNENTLKWLAEHYEAKDGICLPRCLLYENYQSFMKTEQPNIKPIGAAAFGKLVRQMFPGITTRRLGTRGQSKYHYYGISIKSTSPYFHQTFRGGECQMRRDAGPVRENRPKHIIDSSQWSPSSDEGSESDFESSQQPHRHYFNAKQRQSKRHQLQLQRLFGDQSTIVPTTTATTAAAATTATSNRLGERSEQEMTSYLPPLDGPSAVLTSVITTATSPSTYHQQPDESYGLYQQLQQQQGASTESNSRTRFQADFPRPEDFEKIRPREVSAALVSTFLLMYQQHSRRLLDNFELANTADLEQTVTHFWSEMPVHLAPLMSHPFLNNILECVDILLYQTLEDLLRSLSLMPDMSTTFVRDIRVILSRMDIWMNTTLLKNGSRMRTMISDHMTRKYHGSSIRPLDMTTTQLNHVNSMANKQINELLNRKRQLFTQFAEAVHGRLDFYQMAKNCRALVGSPELTGRMVEELCVVYRQDNESELNIARPKLPALFASAGLASEHNPSRFCKKEEDEINVLDRLNDSFAFLLETMHQAFHQFIKSIIDPSGTRRMSKEQLSNEHPLGIPSIDLNAMFAWANELVNNCVMNCPIANLDRKMIGTVLWNVFNAYNAQTVQHLVRLNSSTQDEWNSVLMCLKEYLRLEITRCIRFEEQEAQRAFLMGKSTKPAVLAAGSSNLDFGSSMSYLEEIYQPQLLSCNLPAAESIRNQTSVASTANDEAMPAGYYSIDTPAITATVIYGHERGQQHCSSFDLSSSYPSQLTQYSSFGNQPQQHRQNYPSDQALPPPTSGPSEYYTPTSSELSSNVYHEHQPQTEPHAWSGESNYNYGPLVIDESSQNSSSHSASPHTLRQGLEQSESSYAMIFYSNSRPSTATTNATSISTSIVSTTNTNNEETVYTCLQ